MDDEQHSTPSGEIGAAIGRSTEFSRALYRLQPDTVNLPPLLGADGVELPGAAETRLRMTVAGALFSIALDHHAAVLFLLQHNMRSSAFALLRAIYDATWRGAWAAYVAPGGTLDAFVAGRYDPKPDASIRALEKQNILPPVLSRIHKLGWEPMSAYVHAGSRQVQRWIGDGVVEPGHSDAEVLEVLNLADRLAFMSCVLFLDVAKQERDDLREVADKFLREGD